MQPLQALRKSHQIGLRDFVNLPQQFAEAFPSYTGNVAACEHLMLCSDEAQGCAICGKQDLDNSSVSLELQELSPATWAENRNLTKNFSAEIGN